MNMGLENFWFLCQCLSLEQDTETIERLRKQIREGSVDWQSVVRIADEQLVSPALWISLKNKTLSDDLPDDYKGYLSGLHKLNLQRNTLIRRQAEEIIKSLNSVGIEPILLKGAALLFTNVVSDDGVRILGDLDIMVLSTEAEASSRALSSLGYTDLYHDVSWHVRCQHLIPMIREGELARIELHTQLFHADYDIMVLTAEDCFRESIGVKTDLLSFKVLSISHFIINNIVHGEIHHRNFYNGFISLRRLLDLATISAVQQDAIDWISLENKMTESGVRFIYWSYLHMASALLNASVSCSFAPYVPRKNDVNYGFEFLTFLESSGQRDIFRISRDDRHGHSQLYVDSGTGFNESESAMIHDTIHKPLLVFSLKDFDTIKSLRFDPIDSPCLIEIIDANLKTENGSTIPVVVKRSNAIHHDGNQFSFSTNDPIILMDFVTQDERISTFEIRVNYLLVGYLALRECIMFQEKLLSDQKCQISALNQAVAQKDIRVQGLLESHSWRLTAPLRFLSDQCIRVRRFLSDILSK